MCVKDSKLLILNLAVVVVISTTRVSSAIISNRYEPCNTTHALDGLCMELENCQDPVLKEIYESLLMKQSLINQSMIDYLIENKCGWTSATSAFPLVCCPLLQNDGSTSTTEATTESEKSSESTEKTDSSTTFWDPITTATTRVAYTKVPSTTVETVISSTESESTEITNIVSTTVPTPPISSSTHVVHEVEIESNESISENECTDGNGMIGRCKFLENCQHLNELKQKCDAQSSCKGIPEKEKSFLVKSIKACKNVKQRREGLYFACCSEVPLTTAATTVATTMPQKTKTTRKIRTTTEASDSSEESKEIITVRPTRMPRIGKFDYDALFKTHLPTTECGTPDLMTKILNGKDTQLTDHPWMVALMYENGKTGKLENNCGGTIISKRFVISAAHCTKPDAVRVGEWKFSTNPDCQFTENGKKYCNPPTKDFYVNKWKIHPGFISQTKQNDIALIRLSLTIQWNQNQYKDHPLAFPICLSAPFQADTIHQVADGQNYTVVGWGKTENGLQSDVKQELQLAEFDSEECKRLFRRDTVIDSKSQLCAGGVEGKDSCQGDSGGPLLNQNDQLRYYLKGIVSYGTKCGTANVPGIYTRVSYFMEWILETIETI